MHGTQDRKPSTWELIYAAASGFILGTMIATAILLLVYFGVLWKVNGHE